MPDFNFNDQSLLAALTGRTNEIRREVMQVELPDITYPQLVPVNTSYADWQDSAGSGRWQGVGAADWVSGYADDVPVVELAGSELQFNFEMFGVGYRYNIEELGKANFAGFGTLTSTKALVARRKSEEFAQRIAIIGDARKGYEGITNLSGATATQAAVAWRNSTGVLTATAEQVLADVNALILGPVLGTSGLANVEATTIGLDPVTYRLLASTPAGVLYGTRTILSVIQGGDTGSPAVSVVQIPELATAGADGGPRVIAYANRLDVLELPVAAAYRLEAGRPEGTFGWKVPGWGRMSGVQLHNADGVRYLDEIVG